MVPQQFELVENQQQRIRVVGRIDAIELTAVSGQANERAGPRDAHRGPGDGGDAPFESRLGAADGSPLRLRRGRSRRHDRGRLGVIARRKSDLGAEGASEAVANDDAGRARRGERPPRDRLCRRRPAPQPSAAPRAPSRSGARPPPPMKPLETPWPKFTKRPTPRKGAQGRKVQVRVIFLESVTYLPAPPARKRRQLAYDGSHSTFGRDGCGCRAYRVRDGS